MREEFERLVALGKLSRHHIEPLVALATHGYCHHRAWGCGKVTTMDTVLGRITIDFQNKPGHSMDLGFAAELLKPIPPDHILARKFSDLNGLRQTAALHHLDLIKLVLKSYDGRASLDQVQQVLVPDVITEDWKKWWEVARREMKKDGHFQVPTKKTDPIVYQAQEVAPQERLLADIRMAKGLKNRLTAVHELLRSIEDLADKPAAGAEVIALLNADIASHQKTMPALALEAIFAREDLRQALGLPPVEGEISPRAIWSQAARPGPLLEQVSSPRHRRALESFVAANPAGWDDALLASLNASSPKLAGETAGLLIQRERMDRLKDTLARLISQHNASSELLLWLARDRSDAFADVLGPEVFRAMLSAIERDQFNEKKSNKLRDYILDDHRLLIELIETADIEVIKDLTRALQLSPSFDDMDKRSLLGRIVKHFPAVQSLISGGDHVKQDTNLVVSWESLERRKEEYRELVQKKIPANARDIAVARSYGDLRENHEYKAAKETQKVLMRRKGELESQLSRARGTDFANPRTDQVSIGTRVEVSDLDNGHREAFTILGAWDFDHDRGIISYLSPVGQALLNRAPGDEVVLDTHGEARRFRIETISAAIAVAAPPSVPAPAPAPASTPAASGDSPATDTATASPVPPIEPAPGVSGAAPVEPAPAAESAPPPP